MRENFACCYVKKTRKIKGRNSRVEGAEGEEKYNEITKHEERNYNIYELCPVKISINVL
jgi:hypothetical protein